MLTILNSDAGRLTQYICRQLDNLFPDDDVSAKPLIDRYLPQALFRLHRCINAVKMWRLDEFDYLHSSQYTIFLYYLSNTIWQNERQRNVCNKLFYLNKALNGIDLFYEIEMPEIFFIGHSVGIVLAKATYGNYLVLYQNSTVGKNHGHAPCLGEGVVIYPNSAIIGKCEVANNSVVSQGTSIIDQDTKENCICFQAEGGKLSFKQAQHRYLEDYFRF
jgi:serine O-acetyltransferase